MHTKSTIVVLAFAVFLLTPAFALINPNFTPVHLVRQSSRIVELSLPPVKGGKVTADITRVLVGKEAGKTIAFTLSTSAFAEHVKKVEQLLAGAPRGSQAIFFSGDFEDQDKAGEAPADAKQAAEAKGFLHVAGTWVSFTHAKDGSWEMDKIAETLGTTWNGGTDMLIRCADYILSDEDADVPVKEGMPWAATKQFATVPGAVHAAIPVDLVGDGALTLHVTSEAGDKLFKFDAKDGELKDVTAAAKLSAKSKVAAWADVNADGRMDLVSYDGTQITIHTQAADGTFTSAVGLPQASLPDGCLSLTCLDAGKPGKPAVVIATKSSPLLWSMDDPRNTKPIGGAFAGADLGTPGPCLVADFDDDGMPDLVQLLGKGSLIYKGKALGQFDDPKRCPISIGAGQSSAFVGDFDADGLLDIVAVSSEANSRLWNNRGKFQFVDTMTMTGELTYKGHEGAIGGCTGDFNNDGRQDLFFTYANDGAHMYFNRGFRSFGLANGIDISVNNLLPNAADGQQAGCLADVNGDGVQDMVVILKSGDAWVFLAEPAGRCARVVLSSKGPYIGPLTVTAFRDKRSLGAWNVTAGHTDAFIGLPDAGTVTLKYQFPGQKPQEQKVALEKQPARVVLQAQSEGK